MGKKPFQMAFPVLAIDSLVMITALKTRNWQISFWTPVKLRFKIREQNSFVDYCRISNKILCESKGKSVLGLPTCAIVAVFHLIFEITNLLSYVEHKTARTGVLENCPAQTVIIRVAISTTRVWVAVIFGTLHTFHINSFAFGNAVTWKSNNELLIVPIFLFNQKFIRPGGGWHHRFSGPNYRISTK